MAQIYLDHNASMPLHPEAFQAVQAVLEMPGNAASIHRHGRTYRHHLENARRTIAEVLDSHADSIVFTSGGSEGNTTVLNHFVQNHRPILVSSIEHPCVLNAAPQAISVKVTSDGVIDLNDLQYHLHQVQGQGALVAVMYANNETGIIQPITQVVEMAHRAGAYVLCDAVQAVGKVPLSCQQLNVDYLTASAHKVGGLQGCGIIAVKSDAPYQTLIQGGGQEKQRRGGTVNVPGAVSFAVALQACQQTEWINIEQLRDNFEKEMRTIMPDYVSVGRNSERLCNTSLIHTPGYDAQTQLMALDLAGISVSAGSACSSGTLKPSHVLMAMGYSEQQAGQALRISLGPTTTSQDMMALLCVFEKLCHRQINTIAN